MLDNPQRLTLLPHILNAFVKGPEGLVLPLTKEEVKEYTFAGKFGGDEQAVLFTTETYTWRQMLVNE